MYDNQTLQMLKIYSKPVEKMALLVLKIQL